MENIRLRRILFWIAAGISILFTNIWAFWGINENFHEGWYFEKFWQNVLMMFGQYLLVPLCFMILSAVAIKWNRIGAILHLLLAIGSLLLFGGMNAGFFLVFIPLAGLAVLYWFGISEKKKLALRLLIILPLIQITLIGGYFGIRVSGRYNDNNFESRIIEGNGLKLTWAPQGPGWPDKGTTWYEAKEICAHLNKAGTALEENEVNIWRLPTADEAVRSLVRHGENAGGVWDEKKGKATYRVQPDKESPLWNIHLKTIYWWTATEVNESKALIVVYNGGVWPRMKTLKADYLNFRAVKENN